MQASKRYQGISEVKWATSNWRKQGQPCESTFWAGLGQIARVWPYGGAGGCVLHTEGTLSPRGGVQGLCREQEVVPSCWRECRDKKRHLEITWWEGFRQQSEELFFPLIIIHPRRVLNCGLRRVIWENWQNGFGERKKKVEYSPQGTPRDSQTL